MIQTTVVKINDNKLTQFLEHNIFELYTSLEGENPGGSIKDHMVLGALTKMKNDGIFDGTKTLAEASAGSTAQSLAYYCHQLKIPCSLFVPDTLPVESQNYLKKMGCDLHPVPLSNAYQIFEKFCQSKNIIPFNQMKDHTKRVHYHDFGRTISKQLKEVSKIIGAVGTGHSILGAAEGMDPQPRVISAEPLSGYVSGIRNINKTPFGEPEDPKFISLFNQRVFLEPEEYYPYNELQTSAGKIKYPDSFKVTLGALKKINHQNKIEKVFLLGASNKRLSHLA